MKCFSDYTEATAFTRALGNPITPTYALLGLLGELGETCFELGVDLVDNNDNRELVNDEGESSLLAFLAFAEESKKLIRQGELDYSIDFAEVELHKVKSELGDVLWYLNTLALTLGTSLEELAALNVEKLTRRHKPAEPTKDD